MTTTVTDLCDLETFGSSVYLEVTEPNPRLYFPVFLN